MKINNERAYPKINTKIDGYIEFELREQKFKISTEDWHLIEGKRMYVSKSGYISADFDGIRLFLHRMLMGNPKGYVVDHINHDRHDNRRENLRSVTYSQNNANSRRIIRKSKAGYRGVFKKRNKYQATVRFNKLTYHLGLHETPEQAAKAYDQKAVFFFGRSAITNFKIENYDIPEICEADKLKPVKLRTESKHLPCEEPGCNKMGMRGRTFCKKHHLSHEAREIRLKNGGRVYENKRVKEKTEFCIEPGCEKPSFSQNLCSGHYLKLRQSQGYEKPKKKKYPCSIEGCDRQANYIRERLCRNHYKEKHGIVTVRTGRPKAKRVPCEVCGADASANTKLCPKHYRQLWHDMKKRGYEGGIL